MHSRFIYLYHKDYHLYKHRLSAHIQQYKSDRSVHLYHQPHMLHSCQFYCILEIHYQFVKPFIQCQILFWQATGSLHKMVRLKLFIQVKQILYFMLITVVWFDLFFKIYGISTTSFIYYPHSVTFCKLFWW